MRIDVLTLFPDVFDNLNSFSIIKKAIDSRKVEVNTHNLRDYADNSRKVSDSAEDSSPMMPGKSLIIESQRTAAGSSPPETT